MNTCGYKRCCLHMHITTYNLQRTCVIIRNVSTNWWPFLIIILGRVFRKRSYDERPTISQTIVNTSRLRQNGCHFPDNIFNCIFDENVSIEIEISLKFFHKDTINDIPALVQIIVWHRAGYKPLSEPIVA